MRQMQLTTADAAIAMACNNVVCKKENVENSTKTATNNYHN